MVANICIYTVYAVFAYTVLITRDEYQICYVIYLNTGLTFVKSLSDGTKHLQ